MDKKRLSEYSIGERVCYLRKLRNLSQSELAESAGLSRSMIYQIESNKKSPTVDTLYKLGKALDVNPAIFFATEHVHIFDMQKLRANYKSIDDLNDTLYRALDEVSNYINSLKQS